MSKKKRINKIKSEIDDLRAHCLQFINLERNELKPHAIILEQARVDSANALSAVSRRFSFIKLHGLI